MEIRQSARRHGLTDQDILWAVRHAIATADIESNQEEEVMMVIYIGPDLTGNLIEVAVLQDDQDGETAVHAMRMRRQHLRRLLGGR